MYTKRHHLPRSQVGHLLQTLALSSVRANEGIQRKALWLVTALRKQRASDVQVGGWVYAKSELPTIMVYCGTVAKYKGLKCYAEYRVRDMDDRLDVLTQHAVDEVSRSEIARIANYM
jgi:hypothetical protein